MSTFTKAAIGAVALAASSTIASAQNFQVTGSNTSGGYDQSWQVSCTVLGGTGSPCPTGFNPAAVVTATPAGWQNVPTSDGARYISVVPSASMWSDTPNEDPHYSYTFQTNFNLGALNPANTQMTIDAFAFDNYWIGGELNGHAITLSPGALPPDGENWTHVFQLAVNNGFVAGNNTLDITIEGNGRTDGLLVDKPQFTTTPEPSSMALLGSGLVGLVPMIRRRRKSA